MSKKELVSYVKSQNKKLSNQKIGQISLFFKEPFVNDIDFELVFKKVDQLLPDHILELVDIVYVGDFDYFKERDINAVYTDSALYISHQQDDENDLIDDIMHEFAHAVEDGFGALLYEDGLIEQNFLSKRTKLKSFLNYESYNIDNHDFGDAEYNKEMDTFLKDDVGYKTLNGLTQGLFLGSYSTVSLREYFARGFEEYYLGDRDYLKNICPYIYKKLSLLDSSYNEENNYEF